jgi:uncharacterized membrane protein
MLMIVGVLNDVGTVGTSVRHLEVDLRALMQPHTAINLKVRLNDAVFGCLLWCLCVLLLNDGRRPM